MATYRITMMCSEKAPLLWHRFVLCSRALRDRIAIAHIPAGGELMSQQEVENRLVQLHKSGGSEHREGIIMQAYDRHAVRIGYRRKKK